MQGQHRLDVLEQSGIRQIHAILVYSSFFLRKRTVIAKEREKLENGALESDIVHRFTAHSNAVFQNSHQNELTSDEI